MIVYFRFYATQTFLSDLFCRDVERVLGPVSPGSAPARCVASRLKKRLDP